MEQSKANGEDKKNYSRANQILEVIMLYARLDFSGKIPISKEGDVFDAIAAGVNMLGEELKSSVVSLREKEQLLKEIHHRVKNNLQIIYSLLNLQSSLITDEAHLEAMRDSRNRIKSMALVHEMLYSSSDLSSINLDAYIRSLIQHLSFTYSNPRQDIKYTMVIDKKISLEIDRMIPLGLLVNEMISNSLKYAFPERDGEITLKMESEGEYYLFTISDNGIGLYDGFDASKVESLGMQLIFMLADQMDADLKMESKNGLTYYIKLLRKPSLEKPTV